MKKLIMFLSGLVLLGLTGGAIYIAGAMFDVGISQQITPYFFQPNNLSQRRPGIPQTPRDMGDAKFLDLLVRKYITEYFYVAPDAENIARRTSPTGVIASLSSATVFDEWLNGEAQNIQKLAEDKSMRTAHVIDSIYKPRNSQYWVVNYELKTWSTPNNFSIAPTITRGTMYMDIIYSPDFRPNKDIHEIHQYLEDGGDPAAVFYFRVNSIIQG